jgi:hypothetical protein
MNFMFMDGQAIMTRWAGLILRIRLGSIIRLEAKTCSVRAAHSAIRTA